MYKVYVIHTCTNNEQCIYMEDYSLFRNNHIYKQTDKKVKKKIHGNIYGINISNSHIKVKKNT